MTLEMVKLNGVCVPLPQDRIYMQDVDAIEVEIRCGPVSGADQGAVFMLSVDCQIVIEGFTTTDYHDGDHTMEDDCEACHDSGCVNDEYEADCYRFDTIAMDAFVNSLASVPELRMFSENAEHCIESDHWMITVARTEN